MIWVSFDTFELEEREPAFRSCWECNSAHDHLMDSRFLHMCFACGRYFIFGVFLETINSDEEMANLFEKNGVKIGESSLG